jgi:hypothetical protein
MKFLPIWPGLIWVLISPTILGGYALAAGLLVTAILLARCQKFLPIVPGFVWMMYAPTPFAGFALGAGLTVTAILLAMADGKLNK